MSKTVKITDRLVKKHGSLADAIRQAVAGHEIGEKVEIESSDHGMGELSNVLAAHGFTRIEQAVDATAGAQVTATKTAPGPVATEGILGGNWPESRNA